LQTGCAAAASRGHSHAVTIDTDGQLDPEEIPALLAAARREPGALILGVRDETRQDYPARSRIGRRLSNLAIRLECGAAVRDSQCGFRVYPLQRLDLGRVRAGRFGFEAEVITRAVWAGCGVVHVPVSTRYFPGAGRVTHFKPLRDTLHGVGLHGRLLLTALGRRVKQRAAHR
jgi:hypothetical protein